MTVSLANDSDGITHQLWAQRQANSCSVASIWMARGIARQMSIAEEEWELAYRMYHAAVAPMCWENGPPPMDAPQTLDPGQYAANQSSMANTFASTGVYGDQVTDMLRHEGFTVTHVKNSGTAIAIDQAKLRSDKPAIVLVGWYGGGAGRNGGHFVVAARKATNGLIVYLDPWGGVLRETLNNRRYPGGGLIEEVIYLSA